MNSDNSVTHVTTTYAGMIPLPLALYESNGVIFELYRGGRAYEPRSIRWERLKTFEIQREDGLTFHVRLSQAHLGNSSQ